MPGRGVPAAQPTPPTPPTPAEAVAEAARLLREAEIEPDREAKRITTELAQGWINLAGLCADAEGA